MLLRYGIPAVLLIGLTFIPGRRKNTLILSWHKTVMEFLPPPAVYPLINDSAKPSIASSAVAAALPVFA